MICLSCMSGDSATRVTIFGLRELSPKVRVLDLTWHVAQGKVSGEQRIRSGQAKIVWTEAKGIIN